MEEVEKLKQKIKKFNELMAEISEQFTSIFKEGKEKKYHDIVLDMIKALDQAQQTVRKAYNLSLAHEITEN